MHPAPIPLNEPERIRELYSYEVLDTGTEKALEDIVQSAAAICGTTFGAISLIDKDRQWFKAQCGFSLKQTLRSESICGHGILTRTFFEVPDTHADLRFKENELLESLGVRFYGGTQLIGTEGNVLGMLCVLDPEPQRLSQSQQTQLATLAMRAMELLESHRQRRRMEWLGALVSQVSDEIYLFDLGTHVLLHANESATRNRLEDIAALGLEDITPDVPAGEMASVLKRLQDGGSEVAYETWVERARGLTPVEARWQRLTASGNALVMCTLRDITDKQKLEQAKNEFISVVSHELRTPLTGLYGSIKLLESGACGELPPAAVTMIGISSRSADDLLRLINDILDLEKNTAGLMSFDIVAIELLPLLDELVLGHSDVAALSDIRLENEASLPVSVMADRQRLRQVLGNLISNALKFAPASTCVTLNAFIQENGFARISVTDQGPGVPPDFQSKLFQRFSQANSTTTRPVGGSGLGLSIVKSITESMGGMVACSSRPGCTEFRIEFPPAEQDQREH